MRALVLTLLLCGCRGAALPYGTDSESCGTCHAEQYVQWASTAHARSAASPVFQALLPRVEEAWGATARARCVACHQPRFGGDEGIGCVSCHAAVGNRGHGNGALVVSLDAPLAGTKRVSNAAHDVEFRSLLASPVLCGTCHEVHGPGLLDEPTLSEFAAAASATECITCHSAAVGREGAATVPGACDGVSYEEALPSGAPRRSHRLIGVDPAWGAPAADAACASHDSRALWARALSLEMARGDGAAEVSVTNTGAAHAVPTGATHLRDVWVDVEATDASGRRLLFPRVLELGARLIRDGEEVALVTQATRMEPRGLSPGGRRTVRVALPAGAGEVTAVLRARAVRADALGALQLEVSRVPTLDVARAAAGR